MSKSRDLADSAATINYIDTVTSNVQDQIDNIDALPSQTGNTGKFLTTNGTAAAWDAVDVSSEITGTLPVANGGTGVTTSTGTGAVVLSTSPTLVTPALGTPSALVATNASGTAASLTAGVAEALKSATTTVNTSSATAPALGQVLTATGASAATWQDAAAGGSLEATASGTLANGDTVVVNSDGTVSAVTGSSAIEGIGTLTAFNSASSQYMDSVYDEANNKIVVGYKNAGTGSYDAQVGTVSGSSISWGTAVQVHTETSQVMSLTYDKNAGKILFVYAGASILAGRVGTVSGTTISFGTQATLYSGAARVSDITSGYDVNTQKHGVFFIRPVDFYALALVATISGTTVSAGSTTTLLASSSYNGFRPKNVTYDETAQKLVIFYMDQADSEKGKANVCTISGTTISFGTQAEWSAGTVDDIQAAYSPSLNKHMIVWREKANSNYGTSIIATVSGTTITFGDLYVFESSHSTFNAIAWDTTGSKFTVATKPTPSMGNIFTATVTGTAIAFSAATRFITAAAEYNILTYDPDEGKVIGVYRNTSTGYGMSYVWTTGFFSSNMTATNFIGFSDAVYTNGQTATVQIVAAQDDAQAGLTAGQAYYVHADGDLYTTADSVSVYAGVAMSATNIIIKG